MGKTCGTCDHWRDEQCHRFPPVPYVYTDQTGETVWDVMRPALADDEQACGEHKPQEPSP